MEFNTTQTPSEDETGQSWFDQFLADYDYTSPKRGQVLEGEILSIDEDGILVDVGMKRTAIVPSRDIGSLPDEYLKNLSVGDPITVYVERPPVGDQDLLVSLSKGIEYEHWDQAERYLENGEVLDLEIVGQNRGGLLIQFESLRGFLPYSQVPELRRVRDRSRADQIKRELIGTTMPVKVIEIDRDRRRLIFSARAAQIERRKLRLEELEVGQIIRGPVVNIVKFGIFVDLDGVDGLVHISKLDWQRVDHPSDLFKPGDEVVVKVIDVDVKRERVSLDRKSLQPSPWDTFATEHLPGETMEGRVTNVLDFGAFVELMESVEGLVHVSEIGYSTSGKPQDLVHPGEKVLVRILNIDRDRERISLSMRQVPLEAQIAWSLEHTEEDQSKETAEANLPSVTAEMKDTLEESEIPVAKDSLEENESVETEAVEEKEITEESHSTALESQEQPSEAPVLD
jgi:small subunit ribosomal protein S1